MNEKGEMFASMNELQLKQQKQDQESNFIMKSLLKIYHKTINYIFLFSDMFSVKDRAFFNLYRRFQHNPGKHTSNRNYQIQLYSASSSSSSGSDSESEEEDEEDEDDE